MKESFFIEVFLFDYLFKGRLPTSDNTLVEKFANIVTIDDVKNIIVINDPRTDWLLPSYLSASRSLCSEAARLNMKLIDIDDPTRCYTQKEMRTAVLYSTNEMNKHRESTNYCALLVSIRDLLTNLRMARLREAAVSH